MFGLVPKLGMVLVGDQPLLHSEHNTGYTNNTHLYGFRYGIFLGVLLHLVTKATMVPSKQIPKVFLRFAHTRANKNRQLE